MIDGLLNLSRVARTTLHREKVDLSELARSILRDLQQHDPQRRVKFAIDETPDVDGSAKTTHSRPEGELDLRVSIRERADGHGPCRDN